MTDAKTETEDEKAFNDTLKRMLKTPPTPHDGKEQKKKGGDKLPPPDRVIGSDG